MDDNDNNDNDDDRTDYFTPLRMRARGNNYVNLRCQTRYMLKL